MGVEVGASDGGVVFPRPFAVGHLADGVLEAAVDEPGGTSGVVHYSFDEFLVAVEPVGEGDEVADASAAGGDLSGAGVYDDQAANDVGTAGGEDVAVSSAHRVADDDEVSQFQGVGDGVKVLLVGVEGVVGVGGPLGVAVSAGVQGDDVAFMGEGEGDEIPAVALLADAVEHEQSWVSSAAPFEVVEAEAVGLDVAVGGEGFGLEGYVEAAGGFVEGESLRFFLMGWWVLHGRASPFGVGAFIIYTEWGAGGSGLVVVEVIRFVWLPFFLWWDTKGVFIADWGEIRHSLYVVVRTNGGFYRKGDWVWWNLL